MYTHNTLKMRFYPLAVCLVTFVSLMAVVMVGCAALQTVAPKTLDQRIAAFEISVKGAVDATTALFNSGRVSKEDALSVLTVAEELFKGIKTSRIAMKAGDLTSAENQLKLMQLALLELNSRIAKLEAEGK